MKEEYCIPEIVDDTPMEFIVPTTSEAGVCTAALVDFLTLTHNTFIESCRRAVCEHDQRYAGCRMIILIIVQLLHS